MSIRRERERERRKIVCRKGGRVKIERKEQFSRLPCTLKTSPLLPINFENLVDIFL